MGRAAPIPRAEECGNFSTPEVCTNQTDHVSEEKDYLLFSMCQRML